jgi:hypothetical protein
MNPYLEEKSVFHSFHEQFAVHCAEVLTKQVRPKYFVTLDKNIYIHELPASQRLLGRPDVIVGTGASRAKASHAATLVAPHYGEFGPAIDVLKEVFVEIHERETKTVVTAVELLSPTNKKPGPDHDAYCTKRLRLFRSQSHFVEIDLLRGWQRMPVEGLPNCDYCVLVSKSDERPRVGLWPLMLRDPLPKIPIPLLPGDAPAELDLQSLLHRLYDAGGYEDYIYSGRPEPPLSAADQTWADEIVGNIAKL